MPRPGSFPIAGTAPKIPFSADAREPQQAPEWSGKPCRGRTGCFKAIAPLVPERFGRLAHSVTPCYPNRRAFSRSRSSRISLSSASASSSALSVGSTSSPLRTTGFTSRGFLSSRLSRMSVTLPSGSLSASKLACGGNNKSHDADFVSIVRHLPLPEQEQKRAGSQGH